LRCAVLPLIAAAALAGSAREVPGASSGPGGVVFTEQSRALGIDENGIDIWGVAVNDWNADGCDDLYVGRHYNPPRLYGNRCRDGSAALLPFRDETWRLRMNDSQRETEDRHAVAFGDYDGDGRQDLFVTGGGDSSHHPGYDDQLYHQLTGGDFADVAPAKGMRNQHQSGRFGLWFDYDRDGDLDLFVGNHLEPPLELNRNYLWRNGGGEFVEVATEAGVATHETSFTGAATDLDADGDLDLITAPGEKAPSVYENRGDGTFLFKGLGRQVPGGITSVAPADYDNDGDIDLFLSRNGNSASQLLRNDSGTWTDVTTSAQVAYRNGSSALWIDANNDGRLDLYLARVEDGGAKQPNVLLLSQVDGTFVNVAQAAGVAGPTDVPAARVCAAWGDFNRDGRVDLVSLTKQSRRAVELYVNRTQSGNNWITLRLADPTSLNHQGLGAKVWIRAGGRTQFREVVTPMAEWSQSPGYLMVGVGTSSEIAELEIRWPDGSTETYADVAVGQRYVATKGAGLGEDSA
jgi:hypothetical protein